jgi:hypothetical protein
MGLASDNMDGIVVDNMGKVHNIVDIDMNMDMDMDKHNLDMVNKQEVDRHQFQNKIHRLLHQKKEQKLSTTKTNTKISSFFHLC